MNMISYNWLKIKGFIVHWIDYNLGAPQWEIKMAGAKNCVCRALIISAVNTAKGRINIK